MTTRQEMLIEANRRGLLTGDKKDAFDEAVSRGLISTNKPTAEDVRAQTRKRGGVTDRFTQPAAAMALGAAGEVAGGLSGIVTSLLPGKEGVGARTSESVKNAFSMKNFSDEGMAGAESVAEFPPIKWLGNAIKSTENALGDAGYAVGGPALGAAGKTLPEAVMSALGLGFLKKLRIGNIKALNNAGKPTKQLRKALRKAEIDFIDLSPESIASLKAIQEGVDIDSAVRKVRFDQQGIRSTKGDVTHDFNQLGEEQRLASMINNDDGGLIRARKLEQSQDFERHVEGVIDELGATNEAGSLMKSALSGRKKLLNKEKTALYEEFARTSDDVKSIPVITDTIKEAMPAERTTTRIMRGMKKSDQKAIKALMVEFGINKDAAAVERFIKKGGEIEPLNIGNFDDFRVELNRIMSGDKTGRSSVILGGVKAELDNQAKLVAKALDDAGVDSGNILKPLEDARAKVMQVKTEFAPDALVGKLILNKNKSGNPVIEASKAIDAVLAKSVPVEDVSRVIESLGKFGNQGNQAIKAMQASIFRRALDASLKSPSRKIQGIETVGGNNFASYLKGIGDEKLAVIFKSNPKALRQLKATKQTALDITPDFASGPKGGAPIVMETARAMARKLTLIPGGEALATTVRFLAGRDTVTAQRALNNSVKLKRSVRIIKQDMPQLAAFLGLTGVNQLLNKEVGNNGGKE